MRVSRRVLAVSAGSALAALTLAPPIGGMAGTTASSTTVKSSPSRPAGFQCNNNISFHCLEVYDSEKVFGEGHYVGHDEPSLLYNSNQAGSGNRMQWQTQLPTDPAPSSSHTKSYTF